MGRWLRTTIAVGVSFASAIGLKIYLDRYLHAQDEQSRGVDQGGAEVQVGR